MHLKFFNTFFLLSLSVFVLFYTQDDFEESDFFTSVSLKQNFKDSFVLDEYLILPTEGFEQQLEEVLINYNLIIDGYLDKWLKVKKTNAHDTKIAFLDSKEGKSEQDFVFQLEENKFIHAASLNFLQTKEDSCSFISLRKKSGDTPNDPLYHLEWQLSKSHGLNVKNAWNITKGNPKNVLAVVDRNFNLHSMDSSKNTCATRKYFYEDFTKFFPKGFPPDSYPHGDEVLSVLAPCTNNEIGLAAIDWYTTILAIDTKSDKSLSTRMKAILWASGKDLCGKWHDCKKQPLKKNEHPAKIINASFGFADDSLVDPPYGPILDIIAEVNNQGSIVVSSAGNEATFADRRLPAAAGGVISVGASDFHRRSPFFSNYGQTVDVLAPGMDVIGFNDDHPAKLNGSSFSAPLVSAIASLIVAINPKFSWKHVEYLIKKSAHTMECDDYCPPNAYDDCTRRCCKNNQNSCSNGIADAFEAVKLAKTETFDLPLVDLDDYFITLNAHNGYQTTVKVKNYGFKSGLIKFSSNDKHVRIRPSEFFIGAAKELNKPFIKDIIIYLDKIPNSHKIIKFRFFSSDKDYVEGIIDAVPKKITLKKKMKDL